MNTFVAKQITFSETERILSTDSEGNETVTIRHGYLGISVIPIEKTRKEVLKNITISKISDSSYEKNYDGIEFLDRSTKAEQIEQTGEMSIELEVDTETTGGSEGSITASKGSLLQGGTKRIETNEGEPPTEIFKLDQSDDFSVDPVPNTEVTLAQENTGNINGDSLFKNFIVTESTTDSTNDSSTTGGIKGYISNAKSRTPAKNIFLYNGFNFNYSQKSIETIISCAMFFVKKGFLYELLKSNINPFTINNKPYTISGLSSENPSKNYTNRNEDYKISFDERIDLDLHESSFQFITFLSTSDISNYNYTIQVDNSYDYILLIPFASPKSFNQKKPKLEVFYKKLEENTNSSSIEPTEEGEFHYPSGADTPQNIGDYAALYNHLNKNGVEFFVKKYSQFVENFYKYNYAEDETANAKLYTLKNIKASINLNIEEIHD